MNDTTKIDSDGFTVLGIAAAMLVAVVMSNGNFTYVDSIVGLMIVLACSTVRLDSSEPTILRLVLSLTAGGGLYLIVGVFFEVVLAKYSLISRYQTCDHSRFLEKCRDWHLAGLWLLCAVVAFLAQYAYSKLKA